MKWPCCASDILRLPPVNVPYLLLKDCTCHGLKLLKFRACRVKGSVEYTSRSPAAMLRQCEMEHEAVICFPWLSTTALPPGGVGELACCDILGVVIRSILRGSLH